MSLIPGTGSPDAISAATAANERGYGGCPEDCAGSEDDAGEMEGGFEEGGTAALELNQNSSALFVTSLISSSLAPLV